MVAARGFFPQVAKLTLRRCWGYALLPSQLRRVGRADKVVERRFAGGEGPTNKSTSPSKTTNHIIKPVLCTGTTEQNLQADEA